MMTMKLNVMKKPSRYIVLDTCIFQHFAEKELGLAVINILRQAVNIDYGIAVSDFSFFELLDGASVEKEIDRIKAVGATKRFWVKKNVLIAAAHLGCLYSKDGIPDKQINPGDKVIAATALLTNSIIYTTNGRDFPRPFFRELAQIPLWYKKNDRTICLMSYYLETDTNYIVSKYNERNL